MLLDRDPIRAFMAYPAKPVEAPSCGALSGLTLAVKDLYDVKGYPTGCGQPIKLKESGVRQETAPFVQTFLDAGAWFVGKTITDELAFSLNGKNVHYGTPANRAAPGRIPGGSSSGSAAAVAAGMVDIGLGSDTGGSIRAPASYCGLYGLRPTHGRIDDSGCMHLAPSFDAAGWFTRDIDTYAQVAEVVFDDDTVSLPEHCRVTIASDLFDLLLGDAERAALETSKRAVAAFAYSAVERPVAGGEIDTWYQLFRVLQGFEAWAEHGAWINSRQPDLGPAIRERFTWSSSVKEEAARLAASERVKIREAVADILGDDGLIVLPTVPSIAPLVSSSEDDLDLFRTRALQILCVSGLCGLPQLTLPLATLNGCPLGLSIIGPAGSDRSLIAFARRVVLSFQQA